MFPDAWAHAPEQHLDRLGWMSWNFSLPILASLLVFSVVYLQGWRRMRARRRSACTRLSHWNGLSFAFGMATIFVALVSPIDALSDVLAWVHMLQHTLLMMVAAPLVAFGAPGQMALWALPVKRNLARIFRWLRFSRPLLAWILYAITLWIWHLPLLYEAALADPLIHDLQHLAFFGSSFLFWRVLLEPYIGDRFHPGTGIVYLFVSSIHAMMLGVLMALSPTVWYRPYESRAPLYGFSALEDQQLAGYIMWMPAGLTYVIVAAVLLTRLLREPAR